jgi:signal transduction histidine kinase
MLAAANLLAVSLRRELLLALLCVLALGFGPSARAGVPDDKLSAYRYEDTRRLVSLVEDAADLVVRDGPAAAFAQFAVKGSRWFNDDVYIFVYAEDGTCMFHPVQPELVGRNMMGLRDINDKPVIRLITDVARTPAPDASGWVFYLWEDKPALDPQWKSAYIRKAVAPDGKVYLVGSGSYDLKIETTFVETNVRRACELIAAEGRDAAFKQFRDPASPFVFLNTYIFVLDEAGHLLVDPAYPTLAGRDLYDFVDAMGVPVLRALMAKLQQGDEAAVQYMWARPGSPGLSRKLIYARRIRAGGETLIVGSDFYLATPIWMKSEAAPPWPGVPPV